MHMYLILCMNFMHDFICMVSLSCGEDEEWKYIYLVEFKGA